MDSRFFYERNRETKEEGPRIRFSFQNWKEEGPKMSRPGRMPSLVLLAAALVRSAGATSSLAPQRHVVLDAVMQPKTSILREAIPVTETRRLLLPMHLLSTPHPSLRLRGGEQGDVLNDIMRSIQLEHPDVAVVKEAVEDGAGSTTTLVSIDVPGEWAAVSVRKRHDPDANSQNSAREVCRDT